MKVYLQNPPTIRIGGQVSKSLYQLPSFHPDKQELYDSAQELEKALTASVPGLSDLTSDLAITSPQVNVKIDRDKAASLLVNANADRKRLLRCVRSALGLDNLLRHKPI